jgi:hypothetical protein
MQCVPAHHLTLRTAHGKDCAVENNALFEDGLRVCESVVRAYVHSASACAVRSSSVCVLLEISRQICLA